MAVANENKKNNFEKFLTKSKDGCVVAAASASAGSLQRNVNVNQLMKPAT